MRLSLTDVVTVCILCHCRSSRASCVTFGRGAFAFLGLFALFLLLLLIDGN